jgi:hypothetical protein
MDRALRELVWRRAGNCCEYCQMPRQFDDTTFEIDHVIAGSHGGPTRASNLCLACFACNSFKGSNLSGRDMRTRKIVSLFDPWRHIRIGTMDLRIAAIALANGMTVLKRNLVDFGREPNLSVEDWTV